LVADIWIGFKYQIIVEAAAEEEKQVTYCLNKRKCVSNSYKER
jgi:hypothetical protein